MKIGIIVVYLFKEPNEKMLELHLQQIGRYTSDVPWKIYGCVNRLEPRFRTKLARHPRVMSCECPPTELRGGPENAWYLEHLVLRAIEDGVSHIVALHVDSFPIRDGWIAELLGRLSTSCPLTTTEYSQFTACMVFTRSFYLSCKPTFLLSRNEQESAEYSVFGRNVPLFPDSGIGYLFTAYRQGFTWNTMKKTNKIAAPYATIYDDMIFHFGGAIRYENILLKHGRFSRLLKPFSFFPRLAAILTAWTDREASSPLIPFPLRKYSALAAGFLNFEIRKRKMKPALEETRKRLFADPDAFFHYLRTGT